MDFSKKPLQMSSTGCYWCIVLLLLFGNDAHAFQAEQTITFDSIPDKMFGAPSFQLSATASSGLPIHFEIVSGPATVLDTELTITGKGIVIVRANQYGNDSFIPAAADRLFVVNEEGCEALRVNGHIIDRCSLNGLSILGKSFPVPNRVTLDSLEQILVKETYPDFPKLFFRPKTRELGQQLEDYRMQHFVKEDNKYVRRLEFVMSDQLIAMFEADGVAIIEMMQAHEGALNEIWHNATPAIDRMAKLKRIVIVSAAMYSSSGGGHQFMNDTNFSWSPNDQFNNVPGEIPADIESRWAMDDGWKGLYPYFLTDFKGCEDKPGCRIDYGLLHELTHHLPVGDNYTYNMAQGNDLYISNTGNAFTVFSWSDLQFMSNDHMSVPGARILTAPAAYFIKYYWKLNPKNINVAQASAYEPTEIYGNFFFPEFTVVLKNLGDHGITGCRVLHEVDKGNGRIELADLDHYQAVLMDGDKCIVTLNNQQQLASFPGVYIGLQRKNITLPIFIPRNLIEMMYWKESLNNDHVTDSYTFEMALQPYIDEALSRLEELRAENPEGDISMFPSVLKAYFYNSEYGEAGSDALVNAKIDDLHNYYTVEFQKSRFNLSAFPGIISATVSPGESIERHVRIMPARNMPHDAGWTLTVAHQSPWLAIDTTAGEIKATDQIEVVLSLDASLLAEGMYTDTLIIKNNFNDHIINIRIQLRVGEEILGEIDLAKNQHQLLVHPNPTNRILNVKVPPDVSTYHLIDSSGRIVQVGNFHAPLAEVDLTTHAEGLYMLRCIKTDGNYLTARFALSR